MGVQFGICNFDGESVDTAVDRVQALLGPYAPDGISALRRQSFALLYGSFETGSRPVQAQPYRLPNQDWMMWDGRLDNRSDLLHTGAGLDKRSPDAELAGCTYERLGTRMFSRLIGDWAVSIFSELRREVVLARDFIGVRPLFYRASSHQFAWSTILEPLIFLGSVVPNFSKPYLAGWLSSLPESHLTPYEGIWSVLPSCCIRIRAGDKTLEKYWDFDPDQTMRCPNDREYEEAFYATFRRAVRRRVDSSTSILAELSGGMDSSSIVCMADALFAAGDCRTPRLDTVTYFDACEPNWDELLYARTVERKRGRAGAHIDVGPGSFDRKRSVRNPLPVIPTSPYVRSSAADSFNELVSEGDYRVVLSGLGGDEILGGVPTPVPELADLLVALDAGRFLRQSFEWALAKRKPVLMLWYSVLRQFLPRGFPFPQQPAGPLGWLKKDFTARHRHELSLPSRRTTWTGGLPSFQANLAAVESLRSQLSSMTIASRPTYEWRYPFLDRDLMAFCFSVPREQMVRPHERRSLMRRSLAATVPPEILKRSRKAYVSRALVKIIGLESARLLRCGPLLAEELGIVDGPGLKQAIQDAEQGRNVAAVSLLRALALEDWLRDFRDNHNQPRCGPFPVPVASRVVDRCDERLLGREN